MQPRYDTTGEEPDPGIPIGPAAAGQNAFGMLQAAWERRGRALRSALQAWQESCAALLAALGRGDAKEVADREAACVDRQRALEVATEREAAARDRYLAAFLRTGATLPGGS